MHASQAAPRIVVQNVANRETVYQRLLLVCGVVEHYAAPQGTLLVTSTSGQRSGTGTGTGAGQYEPQVWEINHGYFKALVPLSPGPNELTLQLFARTYTHASQILAYDDHAWHQREPSLVQLPLSIWYQRDRGTPPLHLAILVARDSPALRAPDAGPTPPPRPRPLGLGGGGGLAQWGRHLVDSAVSRPRDDRDRSLVDAPPGEQTERLRQLSEVKRRFALQAYLWQAFHGEQMHRNGLGRRTFALDDRAGDDAPVVAGRRREISEYPNVHVLVSDHSVREFLDPDNAQQYPNAKNGGAMHSFAHEVLSSPKCPREIKQALQGPVAVLILDTHWDPSMPLLRGHAAVGSADPGGLSFGVMGSHWIWAAPNGLDEVTEKMLSHERTDERHCVNDLGECSYAFETLNIGSGAMIHEVGHAFNNPHWPGGIMLRGYVEWNRAFMTREGPRTQRHAPGEENINPITPANDSGMNYLHRLQAVRGRWHPSQALPTDPPLPFYDAQAGPEAYRVWCSAEPIYEPGVDGMSVRASCGIGAIEVYTKNQGEGGDGDLVTHVEFTGLPPQGHRPPSSLVLDPKWLSSLVSFDVLDPSARTVRLNVVGCNLRQTVVEDYRNQAFVVPIRLPGVPFGVAKGFLAGQLAGPERLHVFRDTYSAVQVSSIIVRAGAFVDGLEVVYSDGSRWGEISGGGGSAYRFDLQPGEHLATIHVRSGAWIDAVQLELTSGRRSAWYGGTGGGERTLSASSDGESVNGEKAPNQSAAVGLYGATNGWLYGLGLLRRV